MTNDKKTEIKTEIKISTPEKFFLIDLKNWILTRYPNLKETAIMLNDDGGFRVYLKPKENANPGLFPQKDQARTATAPKLNFSMEAPSK